MNVPPPHADLSGAILSRKYRLKRPIGSGGMGSVYEAENLADGSGALAIKMLAPDWVSDDEVRSRFLEEGRTCQRLIHPNIVRVFDVDQAEDGTPYIVMELLDGVPLSAYTRSGVRVPPQQAATILQGVLAGLSAAHAQGIVHRDLKPENVLLARDPGGAFVAKILDFGIAKVMDAAGGMGHRTRTGVLLGTPAYMSPEQINDAKDVDARSDVWSAGVMLYEMLSGRVAFPAPTEYARLAAVLNTNPAPLETLDRELSRFSSLVQSSMTKDRAQRLASALEMARMLGSIGDGAIAGGSTTAIPLSRLPDVASVWAPVHGDQGRKIASGFPPPAPPTVTQGGQGGQVQEHDPRGPGGTLASPSSPPRASESPPNVVMVGATQGTLPSENLPMLLPGGAAASEGVRKGVVVALVLGALAVGFLLGYAARHFA